MCLKNTFTNLFVAGCGPLNHNRRQLKQVQYEPFSGSIAQ